MTGEHSPAGLHEVDIQHLVSGGWFSECVQPSRAAAEAFVVAKLIELGEDPWEARQVAAAAGYTAADAVRYGVRIYPASS